MTAHRAKEPRKLEKRELRILVPHTICDANRFAHVAQASLSTGEIEKPVCGASRPDAFYVLPFVWWVLDKRAVCWNCRTYVLREAVGAPV